MPIAEPLLSMDLDLAIALDDSEKLIKMSSEKSIVEKFPHGINLTHSKSDLRIQIQTDPRYQSFISSAKEMNVLGYQIKVAALEDVLQGKIWANQDKVRRKSKRQKELADIIRLVEIHRHLYDSLPKNIKEIF